MQQAKSHLVELIDLDSEIVSLVGLFGERAQEVGLEHEKDEMGDH